MLRISCLVLLLFLPSCFVVVVDANGNNANPFLDAGVDGGLVRREQPRPNSLAAITQMDYNSGAD
jgi:hypothetical protein